MHFDLEDKQCNQAGITFLSSVIAIERTMSQI